MSLASERRQALLVAPSISKEPLMFRDLVINVTQEHVKFIFNLLDEVSRRMPACKPAPI
jgi:hypothetical protein